jgi:hypothetical protein
MEYQKMILIPIEQYNYWQDRHVETKNAIEYDDKPVEELNKDFIDNKQLGESNKEDNQHFDEPKEKPVVLSKKKIPINTKVKLANKSKKITKIVSKKKGVAPIKTVLKGDWLKL